eukprot:CAMPEP_0183377474 /NCGR_PEP_ID=MMETSP0164_2-20130417/123151_1 /TAXON_ID=221442 /ORGANISM="Coccolithus pelagicus ssp braarudi, Strain PLY182g" /LENGTH=37 /DNA_ID= /DNA_START= /DNA_END= /DNA_ORIENTATION=
MKVNEEKHVHEAKMGSIDAVPLTLYRLALTGAMILPP